MRAAAALAAVPNVRFLTALHRSNVLGAIDAGFTPGMLPGRVALGDSRPHSRCGAACPRRAASTPKARYAPRPTVPCACSCSSAATRSAISSTAISPRAALANVDTVIAVDAFVNESNRRAEVLLAATLWGEKSGTVSNIEGRVQTLNQKVSPEGASMDDWRIAAELAFRLGADLDLEHVDEVTDELARVAPAFAGVTAQLLRDARDGVVLPLSEHGGEIVWRRPGTSLTDQPSWEPIKVDALDSAEPASESEDAAAQALATETHELPAPQPHDLYVWDRQVAELQMPGRDAYALRLVSGRPLYDDGATVQYSASVHNLKRTVELLVAAPDMQRPRRHQRHRGEGDERRTPRSRCRCVPCAASRQVPRSSPWRVPTPRAR